MGCHNVGSLGQKYIRQGGPGSIRLRFGGGTVRAVPVFRSGFRFLVPVSFFLCSSTVQEERMAPVSVPGKRFRGFRFRFLFRERRFRRSPFAVQGLSKSKYI